MRVLLIIRKYLVRWIKLIIQGLLQGKHRGLGMQLGQARNLQLLGPVGRDCLPILVLQKLQVLLLILLKLILMMDRNLKLSVHIKENIIQLLEVGLIASQLIPIICMVKNYKTLKYQLILFNKQKKIKEKLIYLKFHQMGKRIVIKEIHIVKKKHQLILRITQFKKRIQ